jgi:ADP-heptose:LPS heptosyltransferase
LDLEKVAASKNGALRILVTRLRFLGDIVMTTPVVEALKERYPGAHIYYLAGSAYADVLEENPFLEGIIRMGDGAASYAGTIRSLRSMNFTAALDLYYTPATANLLFLSGIPVRIGGGRRYRGLFYTMTWKPRVDGGSAVRQHMHPLGMLDVPRVDGMPRVYLSVRETEWGRSRLAAACGVESTVRAVVAIHPGGSWPSKRWPPSRFVELAKRLIFSGRKVILLTGPGEESIVNEVRSAVPGAVVAPAMGIRETASLIKSCGALVANDGGILHLSVALGLPTVGIFGPTEPEVWFPYEGKGPFEVAGGGEECAPCHLHRCGDPRCMEAVKVDEIEERLSRVAGWDAK